MPKLPISRVVDVTVTRRDWFPTRAGFGVPLLLTSQAGAVVDATTRTRVYGSMEEVSADWASTDIPYLQALAIFSQSPRPPQIKIGFIVEGVLGDTPTATFADEMDALYEYDPDWYWLIPGTEFRDDANIDDLIAWVEAKPLQLFLDSNDPLLEDRSDTTNVAARNKNGAFDRTSVFYHTDPTQHLAAAMAGYTSTRNFDQAGSAYTSKFKRLRTIDPINRPSASVQAITGFVPQLGLDEDEGHFANTYVEIGGRAQTTEGSTLAPAFIDEIHTSDWLIARTQEEVLGVLLNNDRVPYTNVGVHQLVSAVEAVMQRASIAGLIADMTNPETGELLHDYEIEVERVEAIPASQRRQRIAPDIRCTFRYSGAIHYATVRFTMTF